MTCFEDSVSGFIYEMAIMSLSSESESDILIGGGPARLTLMTYSDAISIFN